MSFLIVENASNQAVGFLYWFKLLVMAGTALAVAFTAHFKHTDSLKDLKLGRFTIVLAFL